MSDRWVITFVDGSTEPTPETADKLLRSVSGDLLMAYRRRSYGHDELVKTYVMANVRSWEPL